MKKVFVLLLLALLAWTPAANAAQDATGGQEAENALDLFGLGMSMKQAGQAGAKAAADDPNMMLYSVSWKDAKWNVLLMFDQDKLTTIGLQTGINNRVLMGTIESIRERDYVPLNISMTGKEDIALYTLAAEGKSEKALDAAFDAALGAFADAEKGTISIIFCPAKTMENMVSTLKNKGDEDEAMKKELENVVYAIQMDKEDDKLSMLSATLGTLAKD